MTYARHDHLDDPDTLPRMPSWITSNRAETLEDVAFLSGAALNHLHLVLRREEVPQNLLRERLALCDAVKIADWMDVGQGMPVARAAAVLNTVLTNAPRQEVSALILAEAALAQAFG